MTNAARFLVFLIVCVNVGGCAAGAVPGQVRKPTYYWGFGNPSEEELDKVQAMYEASGVRDTPGAGWLSPGTAKGHGPGIRPIPATATLSWTARDGRAFEKELEVASQVPDPERFTGRIYFIYLGREHGWKVVPLTDQEQEEQAIRASKGTLGQRDPTVPTPDKYLPTTRPTTPPIDRQ